MTDSRFFQACFWEDWTDDIMDNKKILKQAGARSAKLRLRSSLKLDLIGFV